MDDLIQHFQSIRPLSAELIHHLVTITKIKKVPKNSHLIKMGKGFENIYVISKGWMRSYYYNIDGSEVSLRFMKPGDLLVSITNFLQNDKTFGSIQALADVELYYISYKELQDIYERFPESNYYGRIFTEQYAAKQFQRSYMLLLPKAIDRYNYLIENFPELLQRFPSKYLASYMGITQQSLSRLRQNIR